MKSLAILFSRGVFIFCMYPVIEEIFMDISGTVGRSLVLLLFKWLINLWFRHGYLILFITLDTKY